MTQRAASAQQAEELKRPSDPGHLTDTPGQALDRKENHERYGVPTLLTASETARLLRVHRNTVDRERAEGRLECVRIGARVFYTPRQIRDYIEGKGD